MRAPDPGQPFVTGVLDTPAGPVPRVGTSLGPADVLGRWRVRWGIGRDDYRVDAGLYAVGEPDDASPVLVTANYKLSFDVLRSSLDSLPAWVLVLDTRGINVWCAAGKGTFSTSELVARVRHVRLAEVVSHRRLIVPQLGATGVAAHTVRRDARFAVVYGPVRAADIPAFLASGLRATPEMRQPTFTLSERLALTPVELAIGWKWLAGSVAAAFALALAIGWGTGTGNFAFATLALSSPAIAGVAGGAVLTPALLPWLPPRMFSAKGAIVGSILGVLIAALLGAPLPASAGLVLTTAAVSSFVAMNFTGSTPFTSQTGVEREMRRWLPLQVAGALLGGAAVLAAVLFGVAL